MSSFGLNSGAGINPARDMGPRILTALAGWPDTFTVSKQTKAKQNVLNNSINQNWLDLVWTTCYFLQAADSWFWIPWLLPHVGGLIGTLIYTFLIQIHHPPKEVALRVSQ